VWQIPDAVDRAVCAPDDRWKYHPKHVKQFPDINKLCNVVSCWIYEYIGILLRAHPILHISRIRFKVGHRYWCSLHNLNTAITASQNTIKFWKELILLRNMLNCTLEMWYWLSSVWNTTSVQFVRRINAFTKYLYNYRPHSTRSSSSRGAEEIYKCRQDSVVSEMTWQWTTVTNLHRLWLPLVMYYTVYN
jgi:hypothetical protein